MEIFARGVGRRKEAVAQVQIVKGTGQFIINEISAEQYLHHNTCSLLSVKGPLNVLNSLHMLHMPQVEVNSTILPSENLEKENLLVSTDLGPLPLSPTSSPPLILRGSDGKGAASNPEGVKEGGKVSASKGKDKSFIGRFLAIGESVSLGSEHVFSKMDTIVKVKGGGLVGQAEAIRLGLARACCSLTTERINLSVPLLSDGSTAPSRLQQSSSQRPQEGLLSLGEEIRKQLKDKGFLTQDSRVKERRKYGLKKARKATQYNKR
jgi:ribosomal protein S9